ncbi:hypothetical protein [Pseudomonas sp. S2_H01]
MLTLNEEPFLPSAALDAAEKALKNLRSCISTTQALHTSIAVEDTVKGLKLSGVITDEQAKRLYLLFEATLEIMLRDLAGKEDGPRQFP